MRPMKTKGNARPAFGIGEDPWIDSDSVLDDCQLFLEGKGIMTITIMTRKLQLDYVLV